MANFNYELRVQKYLKLLIKDVLAEVEKEGLLGGHHFYITFATNRNNVKIPDFIKQKYPEEMTIVIQHQFWDLNVTDSHFSVKLSFADQPHELVIPFDSIISFLDPSVKFGLRFTLTKENVDQQPKIKITKTPSDGQIIEDNVVTLDQFRKK